MSTATITANDGKSIGVFVAAPQGEFAAKPKGCVIVVQEIFGVNAHIQWVCVEQYAKAGYLVLAPQFFDRIEPSIALAYTPEATAKGRSMVDTLGMDNPMRDIAAAKQQLAQGLPTAVVGYCWGGSVALLAATRLGLTAVSYYGGRSVPYLHEKLQASVLFHFGAHDPLITPEAVAKVQAAYPQAQCHVYDAGHGFNRVGHADHSPAASALALERSLAHIAVAAR
jgi:carboxymethylenebutenolidase